MKSNKLIPHKVSSFVAQSQFPANYFEDDPIDNLFIAHWRVGCGLHLDWTIESASHDIRRLMVSSIILEKSIRKENLGLYYSSKQQFALIPKILASAYKTCEDKVINIYDAYGLTAVADIEDLKVQVFEAENAIWGSPPPFSGIFNGKIDWTAENIRRLISYANFTLSLNTKAGYLTSEMAIRLVISSLNGNQSNKYLFDVLKQCIVNSTGQASKYQLNRIIEKMLYLIEQDNTNCII